MNSKLKSLLLACGTAAIVAAADALIPMLASGDWPDTREDAGRLVSLALAAGLAAYRLHRMDPGGRE